MLTRLGLNRDVAEKRKKKFLLKNIYGLKVLGYVSGSFGTAKHFKFAFEVGWKDWF